MISDSAREWQAWRRRGEAPDLANSLSRFTASSVILMHPAHPVIECAGTTPPGPGVMKSRGLACLIDGFETRVFVARDRIKARAIHPFPPLAKGGPGGVGAHASERVNAFPLPDTTRIRNDLKTGFSPLFPRRLVGFADRFEQPRRGRRKKAGRTPCNWLCHGHPPCPPLSKGGRENGALAEAAQ